VVGQEDEDANAGLVLSLPSFPPWGKKKDLGKVMLSPLRRPPMPRKKELFFGGEGGRCRYYPSAVLLFLPFEE